MQRNLRCPSRKGHPFPAFRVVLCCLALGACKASHEADRVLQVLDAQVTRAARDAGERESVAPASDAEAEDAEAGPEALDAAMSAVGGGMACESRDTATASVVSGFLDTDQTWQGTILVDGDLTIGARRLTIEPGTTILLGLDASISIGSGVASRTTVLAEGTKARPIRFCGDVAQAGRWRFVEFGSQVTRDSRIAHASFADGGAEGPAVRFFAPIVVDTVEVLNARGPGFIAERFGEGSRALSVRKAGGAVGRVTAPAALTHFPVGGEFEDIAEPVLEFESRTVAEDIVFRDLGVPYVQTELAVQFADVEVIFEAGVEYRFGVEAGENAWLEFGWANSRTHVRMQGTAQRPILFRGSIAKSGYWGGMRFASSVASDSTLEHVVLQHGGNGVEVLTVEQALLLREVHLEENATGMRIGAEGLAVGSEGLHISQTDDVPLLVHPQALTSLPSGEFTGNQEDVIAVEAGELASGTIVDLGVPYLVGNRLYLAESELRIDPGVQFIMERNALLEVGWAGSRSTLVAQGEMGRPIRFTGAEARQGYWQGILVGPDTRSDSLLAWVEISDAGGLGSCLRLAVPLSVSNSSFSNCAGFAIDRSPDDPSDYASGNSFSANELGPFLIEDGEDG